MNVHVCILLYVQKDKRINWIRQLALLLHKKLVIHGQYINVMLIHCISTILCAFFFIDNDY